MRYEEEDEHGVCSENRNLGWYTRFCLGSTAVSFVEGGVTYPFDVVKTRQQVASPAARPLTSSTLGYMRLIAQAEGIGSLYRGFGWSVIGGLPSEVSFYLSYTILRDAMLALPVGAASPSTVYVLAGGLADVVSLVLWVPADIISQRMQIQTMQTEAGHGAASLSGACVTTHPHAGHLSGWQVARHLYQSEGARGIFRGLGATIATHSPASAIFWLAYEHGKESIGAAARRDPESSVAVQAGAASLAGMASASITTPLDLIKTRVQCAPSSKSIRAHIGDLWREQATLSGLFRGFLPRVIASAPRSVISLVGYELALGWAAK
mmetsp:Transcript_19843/g.48860  ORF Transcript_19843/g.48860 Transcript_19843/m.48860 type:complete len:322 (-) Transcript_19843:38-1003(-)